MFSCVHTRQWTGLGNELMLDRPLSAAGGTMHACKAVVCLDECVWEIVGLF